MGYSFSENPSDRTLTVSTIVCMIIIPKRFFLFVCFFFNSLKDRNTGIWENPRQKHFSELLAVFVPQVPLGSSTLVDSWAKVRGSLTAR